MQVSREKAAENRERIMETAARMFREAHRRRRRNKERRRSHTWPILQSLWIYGRSNRRGGDSRAVSRRLLRYDLGACQVRC
jgi:hypothetical protein